MKIILPLAFGLLLETIVNGHKSVAESKCRKEMKEPRADKSKSLKSDSLIRFGNILIPDISEFTNFDAKTDMASG